jgi:hypothetical protein
MPDEIYVDPAVTDDVIEVGDICYKRDQVVPQSPNVAPSQIQDTFSSCDDCQKYCYYKYISTFDCSSRTWLSVLYDSATCQRPEEVTAGQWTYQSCASNMCTYYIFIQGGACNLGSECTIPSTAPPAPSFYPSSCPHNCYYCPIHDLVYCISSKMTATVVWDLCGSGENCTPCDPMRNCYNYVDYLSGRVQFSAPDVIPSPFSGVFSFTGTYLSATCKLTVKCGNPATADFEIIAHDVCPGPSDEPGSTSDLRIFVSSVPYHDDRSLTVNIEMACNFDPLADCECVGEVSGVMFDWDIFPDGCCSPDHVTCTPCDTPLSPSAEGEAP